MKLITSFDFDEAPLYLYEDDTAIHVLCPDFSRGIPQHLEKVVTYNICELCTRQQAYKEAYNFIVEVLNKTFDANLNTI